MAGEHHKRGHDHRQAEIDELTASLEALLESYGDEAQDGLEEAKNNAEDLLKKSRAGFRRKKRDLQKNLCNSGCQVDDWIRDNPTSAIGISAAVGLVFGLLLARR